MKIHWYWPFARPEELHWAEATCSEGEELVVQVVDREAAPTGGPWGQHLRVERNLPDVDRAAVGRAQWLASRVRTYTERSRARSRSWDANAPDIAHIHYLNRFTDLRWGGSRPPVLVLSVHDVMPHVLRGPRRIEKQLLRRIYNSADALIVHHELLRTRLQDEFGIDPERLHVIGHQVFPVPEDLRSAKPPDGTPTVLFFGALRANKGTTVPVQSHRAVATRARCAVPLRRSRRSRSRTGTQPLCGDQLAHHRRDRVHRIRAQGGVVPQCVNRCAALHRVQLAEWRAARCLWPRSTSHRDRRRRTR